MEGSGRVLHCTKCFLMHCTIFAAADVN